MSKGSFSSLIHALENAIEAMKPYQEAVSLLKKDNQFADIVRATFSQSTGMMKQAIDIGLFDERLAGSVKDLLLPYEDITGAQTAISALGHTFDQLVKPEVYDAIASTVKQIPQPQIDLPGIAAALEPITHAVDLVDTSWIREQSNWLVKSCELASLDFGPISGMTGAFATLCKLEQETCRIVGIPDTIISAASQIASITEAIKPSMQIDDLFSSTRLLADYCSLAVKQHEMIGKALEPADIEWRLGVLDAASKYVDRQIIWRIGLADQLTDEELPNPGETEELEVKESALTLIPTHIGYTRRQDVQKTPIEGLEESSLVTITEKGKRVAEGILKINRLQLDNGNQRIFGLSETVVGGMVDFGSIVCTNNDMLGKIIDGLYFVFYENLEHIKVLIGNGDQKTGDSMVRNEPVFQCIFRVKTIRSDLRHDLDHGSENERKKKLKAVGDCYKQYCGSRPLRERDYKKLQEKLYDEIIELEEALISYQIPD